MLVAMGTSTKSDWVVGGPPCGDLLWERACSHKGAAPHGRLVQPSMNYAALAKRSQWCSTSPKVALIMVRRLA